jgi:drug/metabolite transporter (DMT)-like permease
MLWLPLTLVCALSWAVSDALAKRVLRDGDALVVATARQIYAAPFLWLLVPFTRVPDLSGEFFQTVALVAPFEVVGMLIYVAAIQRSPLSLTLPYLAFTPAFLVLTSRVVLGEHVTPAKGLGILVVTAGAYVLNAGGAKKGLLEPLKAVGRERGSLMMLAVSAIYSVTASLDKKAVLLSSPEFYTVFYFTLLAGIMAAIAVATRGARALWQGLAPNRWTIGVGATFAVMLITHNLAIRLVEAAYMISVKRTSMIFGVLIGWLFFRERDIVPRLAGAGIMLAGIILIASL